MDGCGVDAGVESGVELEVGLERSTCTLTESGDGLFWRGGLSAITGAAWGKARERERAGLERSSPELVDNSLVDSLAVVSGAAGCCEWELCLGELSLGVVKGLQLPWTLFSTRTGAGSIATPLRDSFC